MSICLPLWMIRVYPTLGALSQLFLDPAALNAIFVIWGADSDLEIRLYPELITEKHNPLHFEMWQFYFLLLSCIAFAIYAPMV